MVSDWPGTGKYVRKPHPCKKNEIVMVGPQILRRGKAGPPTGPTYFGESKFIPTDPTSPRHTSANFVFSIRTGFA